MEENKYNKVLLEVMEKDTQDQDMKESITMLSIQMKLYAKFVVNLVTQKHNI